MVAENQQTVVNLSLKGVGETHARTKVSVRDVSGVIDEPVEREGTNQGLTPTETLMSALIGCTNVITQRIAHHKGVRIEDMAIDCTAELDRRGVTLQEEIGVPFPAVQLYVAFKSDATPDQVEEIKADLQKFCPIAKVIRGSGTKIEETWNVSPL
jgi:uncharacterized OsmC-like protein